jgi:hypothetical protein
MAYFRNGAPEERRRRLPEIPVFARKLHGPAEVSDTTGLYHRQGVNLAFHLEAAMRVPATEWEFAASMPRTRYSALSAISFEEISATFARQVYAEAPVAEKATNRAAPKNTRRFVIPVVVSPITGDLLHNGRDGLRGRYWISPEVGERATARLIALVLPALLRSLTDTVIGSGTEMTREEAICALHLPSTKIWLVEKDQLVCWSASER